MAVFIARVCVAVGQKLFGVLALELDQARVEIRRRLAVSEQLVVSHTVAGFETP